MTEHIEVEVFRHDPAEPDGYGDLWDSLEWPVDRPLPRTGELLCMHTGERGRHGVSLSTVVKVAHHYRKDPLPRTVVQLVVTFAPEKD